MVDRILVGRIAVVAVMAALAHGCSRAPTEQEIAARKAREDAIVQASVEEERQKDRARAAAAAKTAEVQTEAMRRSTPPVEEPAAPRTITMLGPVAPVATTNEEVIAQATARVEMALANPASMLVRNPQTREEKTFVCLEVNSRNAAGSYTGFVPVIVSPTKVHFHKAVGEGRDVSEVSATLDFNRLNERLRCW